MFCFNADHLSRFHCLDDYVGIAFAAVCVYCWHLSHSAFDIVPASSFVLRCLLFSDLPYLVLCSNHVMYPCSTERRARQS